MQRCKTCGGTIERIGNFYVCDYCLNKWEIDSADDVHVVDRANAWSALRDGDFEKAAQLFETIISKEPENHEAYWGRALAIGGIVYVTDMNENKKVPTCNNITEESFVNHKDVQKAISLAPNDIADSYRLQAEYIERVRVEWLQKASQEPAYDVFISFKDSDRENGIERTQDSIDAQDLYNALVADGYKVFFSRISLRDKIAEQYEPYIYNAIKTAKVMIVFGEKAEYFSSVWIKNEWSRFKARIEKGEKHKNSLVTVYKNINPGDLPIVLKSRQCLNASDMTFLSDLTRHIKRVVDDSKKSIHLEKIEIKGGQIAKKATSLAVNAVHTHEIGEGAIAETSISEKQSISIIYTYLSEKQWKDASDLVDEVLFENPSCAEAIWCKILVKYKSHSDHVLDSKIDKFSNNDFLDIEKILNCASKEFAEKILTILYESENMLKDLTFKKLLETILPFSFNDRQNKIDKAFKGVITNCKHESFKLLLNTLETNQVDQYIDYNFEYAKKTKQVSEKKECLNNILSVDEGNINAIRDMLLVDLQCNKNVNDFISRFETLLKYTSAIDDEVFEVLNWLCVNLSTKEHCEILKQILRYYTGEMSALTKNLVLLCYKMLSLHYFAEVEYFLNLILSFDPTNADVYWGICLLKTNSPTEQDIIKQNILLKDIPEFKKYLTLVDEKRRKECVLITKKQNDLRNEALNNELNNKNNELKLETEKLKTISESKESFIILKSRVGKQRLCQLFILISIVSFFVAAATYQNLILFISMISFVVCSYLGGVVLSGLSRAMTNSNEDVKNGCIFWFLARYFRVLIYIFATALGSIISLFSASNAKRKIKRIKFMLNSMSAENFDIAIKNQEEKIKQLEMECNELQNLISE